MEKIAVWSLGSFATQIFRLVENIPTAISGEGLLNLIDQQVQFVEEYTGATIGSVSIAEQYQPPIINLSIAELLLHMQNFGTDASNIRLGDFSISKGQGSNLSDSADKFKERGMEQLKALGWRAPVYQAL